MKLASVAMDTFKNCEEEMFINSTCLGEDIVQETHEHEDLSDSFNNEILICAESRDIHPACASCNEPFSSTTDCSKCLLCEIYIHKADCSTVWNDILVCISCSMLENHDKAHRLECRSVENWKGLGVSSKRKRSSYLESNTEYLRMDWSDTRKVIPIRVLKNEHRPELKPIRVGKKHIYHSLIRVGSIRLCKPCGVRIVFEF